MSESFKLTKSTKAYGSTISLVAEERKKAEKSLEKACPTAKAKAINAHYEKFVETTEGTQRDYLGLFFSDMPEIRGHSKTEKRAKKEGYIHDPRFQAFQYILKKARGKVKRASGTGRKWATETLPTLISEMVEVVDSGGTLDNERIRKILYNLKFGKKQVDRLFELSNLSRRDESHAIAA